MLNKIFYKNYNPMTAVEAEGDFAPLRVTVLPWELCVEPGFQPPRAFSPGFFLWVAVFIFFLRHGFAL